ncbi:MAG: membrane protein [Dehalococcoidia bacterium]|nr:MAG: membrane protein [Dehalococcoidia bacterium]
MPFSVYLLFTAAVLILLLLDLVLFHRRPHAVSLREALLWTLFWVSLAAIFNLGVWYFLGSEKAIEFLTGYLIEQSLSVDNMFVFLLLFTAFAVPKAYQHRLLFLGIVSAIVLRGLMIAIGAYLVSQFEWVLLLFGAFLLFAAVRMVTTREEEEIKVEKNLAVRLVRRLFPVTPRYYGSAFFIWLDGKLYATPMLIVLAVIEATDVMFALDSIPAIFAITRDPFIVYTSNIFAILGLRSLYFLLAGVVDRFYLLKYGLAVVLGFIGLKLIGGVIGHVELAGRSFDLHVPTTLSLAVVAVTLLSSVVASLLFPPPPPARLPPEALPDNAASPRAEAPHQGSNTNR